MSVDIYTDGASRGNPGPGGYGVVLLYEDSTGTLHTKELSRGFRLTTNNRMEVLAACAALEELKRPCEVTIHSDSRLLVDAVSKNWLSGWQKKGWKTSGKQPVKNPDLWKRLIAAMEPHCVHMSWVKGHVGNTYNERCDELATNAADQNPADLETDSWYEQSSRSVHIQQ
ncbi:MAG: ribonuclease HI [Atopobiaceae bacterium]